MKRLFRSLLVVVAGFAASAVSADTDKKPNVLIIYTDDMGYGDVSIFANAIDIKTPHLDKLAEQGLRFTQYYTASPICSPSRAALLTGHYPSRLRVTSYLQARAGNRMADQNDFLDPNEPTPMPKLFQSAGYATAHIGKWHLGGGRDVDNAPLLREYGYDEAVASWESPEPHPALGVKYAPWDHRLEKGQVERYRRTRYMVDRTLQFFDANTTRPIFVTLWPDEMHNPYRPSPEMMEKHGGKMGGDNSYKNFLAVLEEYDMEMGRLIAEIDKRGLANDTIIIFTSDNGAAPDYEHRRSPGMRGKKLSLYEGGIRLPFIVRWTGKTPENKADNTTILSAVDLFPSLLKLTGIEVPADVLSRMDGEDMSQALLGKPQEREKNVLWEYGRNTPGSIPRPREAVNRSPNLAVRKGDFKLLVNDDGTSAQLYNVVKDRGEKHNIIDQHKALADELTSQVISWQKTMPHRNHK